MGQLESRAEPPVTLHLEPRGDESLDRLAEGRQVLQRRRGHRSATDDLLAAWRGATARPDARRVLDLGCGHGTVSLLLSALMPGASFCCVEAQAVSAALARRNMALNGIAGRASVVETDLRQFDRGDFDLVTGTPPFMPIGTGLLSNDPQRAAARFELLGGIEDYVRAAAKCVTAEGAVSMVMDGAQDPRCRAAFADADLSLWSVVGVVPREGREVRYRLYLGGPSPADEADETSLVLRDSGGELTDRWIDIRRFLRVEP